MKFFNRTLILLSAVGLFACGKTNFVPVENSALGTDVLFENTFKVEPSEIQYEQPNLDENKTTVSFQLKDASGNIINDLSKNQIVVTENGQPIVDFNFNKNSVTYTQTVDILFAVDVTGSMAPTIEAAKSKLINFIRNTRAQGYHTRMCLSTFGDYTVSYCNRFYDNDPKDASTETQVNELISEITKLKALTGNLDPGGYDLDENPMRAVIDAANAPWGSDSQRFVILMTDAGFLYSPGHSGDVGALAPIYADVLNAISTSQMKIFAVTPSKSGYEKTFKGSPGIVQASNGEWFKYSDLVSGKITLNTVLNRILSSINTTFFVDYTLNSSSVLDPSLPLSQRNIQIQLVDVATGNIVNVAATSNLPNGRVPDPKIYHVSDKKIKLEKLQVYIDNVLQVGTYRLVNSDKDIEFLLPPAPHAKIKVKYDYDSVKDAISLTPINISYPLDRIEYLKIFINGIRLESKYFQAVAINDYTTSIVLSDDIFSSEDPFKINKLGKMDVVIKPTNATK